MSEPVSATDPTQPLDDQTPQEWADGVAATIGAIFLHNHPDGRDW